MLSGTGKEQTQLYLSLGREHVSHFNVLSALEVWWGSLTVAFPVGTTLQSLFE